MFGLIKAIWHKAIGPMEIILHLGAHRCATTTFQAFLDLNRTRLADHGVAVWTPQNTRSGLFDGVICQPGQDATAHIARLRTAQGRLDADQLIVSEENMIGAPRNNLNHASLYPDLPRRLGRFAAAFDGQVTRLGLAIRSYEGYWVSAMTFATLRGQPLPSRAVCSGLALLPRTWAMIAQDIRALFPQTPLHIWTFEAFAGRPRRQFNMLSGRQGITHLLDHTPKWKNASGTLDHMRQKLKASGRYEDLAMLPDDGPWAPFTPLERHKMAVAYAQDLAYFRSCRDPLIQFTENAAIKVQRRQNAQASPAYDIGEHHDRQAKMG